MPVNTETLEFQAETDSLLDLMINSLYTEKDIFLRELISNASDALDRLRFESLTRPEIMEPDHKFEIRLEVDKHRRTLTVRDSGIGMSRNELIANIGTIARSGTRELRRTVEGDRALQASDFIGHFGVGFYSAFMVSESVKLVTRRAGEVTAIEWESAGDGKYTIMETDKAECGTCITLFLKPVDPEAGIEDYTDQWRLSSIVRRYSDFVAHPIVTTFEQSEEAEGVPTIRIEDRILNSMRPIWTRPPAELNGEYTEFYKHLSNDWTQPLEIVHFRAEGTFEYDALLYVPSKAPYDLYYVAPDTGLRLFAKRVMIIEKCGDLLPRYLRFIKGVVDVGDLPLNISRQRLQHDHHITLIRKRLTRKVLDAIEKMFRQNFEKYREFWAEFGRALKEGATSDHDNKETVISLLLFQSSNDPEQLTTLEDYVARMKPGQERIYYLTGTSRAMLERSPQVEALLEKGFEVLYLSDPVDELLLQHLPEYSGKKLKSAGKGAIDLDDGTVVHEKQEEYRELLQFIQKTLDAFVKQVRLTNRLTQSPVCLVVEEHDYSPLLERVLQKGKGGGPRQRRILEVNPRHQFVYKLQERFRKCPADPVLASSAEMLFGLATLAEGSDLPDPERFNRAAWDILALAL